MNQAKDKESQLKKKFDEAHSYLKKKIAQLGIEELMEPFEEDDDEWLEFNL